MEKMAVTFKEYIYEEKKKNLIVYCRKKLYMQFNILVLKVMANT